MKLVTINGSPRKSGSTKFSLNLIEDGFRSNIKDCQITSFDVSSAPAQGCIGCNSCKINKTPCIFKDDIAKIIEAVVEADIVIFSTPVYWWGITAQLKTVIDRLYSLPASAREHSKKIGLLVVGAGVPDNLQYELIKSQFKCACDFITGWNLVYDMKIPNVLFLEDIKKLENVHKELQEAYKAF